MLPVSMASVTIVFFLSLVLLHVLSSKLVHLLRWRKLWLIPASVGTPIHELSHAIVAIALGHKVHRIQLFYPQHDGGLGFVEHSHRLGAIGYITTALISLAPIVGGLAAVYVITLWLYPLALDVSFDQDEIGLTEFFAVSLEHAKMIWSEQWTWQHWGWLGIVTSITAFMAPSPGDYKSALPGLLIFICAVLVVAALVPSAESFMINNITQLAIILTPILAVVVAALVIAIFILLAINATLNIIRRA